MMRIASCVRSIPIPAADGRFREHIRPVAAMAVLASVVVALVLSGCSSRLRPGDAAGPRQGQEIMVAGRLFHVGAPVVLFTDPGGYDAYRVEKRFTPWADSSWQALVKAGKALDTPNRYGLRAAGLSEEERERVRGGGWDLPLLQRTVDQFVLHYDVCGTSRQCFKVLHDFRGLSVHFLLDLDGTIYQTLDLKERAWHATISNDRSVGIEIANMGAYPPDAKNPFASWYELDEAGRAKRITIPPALGDGGIRTAGFVGRPIRPEVVEGEVQGQVLRMYDLTPEQYDSLTKLTAALCTVLPQIRCDYPRDEAGGLATRKLPDEQLAAFKGVIGHYHIQANKQDPGPALQWDRVIDGARRLMR